MKCQVGQVLEYSDLSPWEPVIVTEVLDDHSIMIEFLDGEQLDVHPTEVRELTWETLRDLDQQRENCVKEIQTLRQSNGHLQDAVELQKSYISTLQTA